MPSSEDLFDRASRVIPGGVNSPVRAFGSVGGAPRFLVRGLGAHVWDADGRRYVDLVQSWGPLPLGHARPEVVAAAQEAVRQGSSFGAPTPGEVELAETLVAAVPSLEQVRLVSSGTEAAMSAVRLARGATRRSTILKFAGHYHGHADALLVDAGSGVATLGRTAGADHGRTAGADHGRTAGADDGRTAGADDGRTAGAHDGRTPGADHAIPGSPGVTGGAAGDTVVVPWNDEAALNAAVDRHGPDLAAVLAEPVAANMGLVPPTEGFLARLREAADATGALLVFDEVITGFRLGRAGAQARYGVTPDVTILGKAIGGGFPLAAFGGRADVMQHLAPVGPVYQAGTLSGNPVAVAAGLAQLHLLTDSAFDALEDVTTSLVTGLRKAFADAGVPATVQQVGTLAGLVFGDAEVVDYASAKRADHDAYARFFHGMLERGVYLAPSGYEVVFTSLAHDEDILAEVVDAARDAATAL